MSAILFSVGEDESCFDVCSVTNISPRQTEKWGKPVFCLLNFFFLHITFSVTFSL